MYLNWQSNNMLMKNVQKYMENTLSLKKHHWELHLKLLIC